MAAATASAGDGAVAKPLEFDTVSVKVDKAGPPGMFRIMAQADGYNITGALKLILTYAYGVREDLISGVPGWANDARYEIAAKVAGPDVAAFQKLSKEERDVMLQSILTSRFQMKAHFETKELPVYELVVAKGGVKMHEFKAEAGAAKEMKSPDGASPPPPPPPPPPGSMARAPAMRPGMMSMRPGMLTAQGIAVSGLTDILSRELQRTVIDKTGLTGKYDLTLKYTPLNGPAPMLNGEPDTSAPSLFTAVEEQLGLKLNSTKGPVKTLVVEHLEAPSEN